MGYFLEAKRKTQTGILTLEDVVQKVDAVHKKSSQPLNGIISQGELVGRSGDSSYRETVFRIALSTSPRSKALSQKDFLNALEVYATELGSDMKQERVYLECNGVTYVYKIKSESK